MSNSIMRGVLAGVTFGLLMMWLGSATAGDVRWSIQLHFPITGHGHSGPVTGNIGTPPNTHLHHDHHVTRPHNNGHYHNHYNDGRYGWHNHQGRRYPVVYEFRNYRGEFCREFQMEVNIGGHYELAWGVACRDYRGYWILSR